MTKRGKFDYILLETTGLADPGLLLIPFCLFVWGNMQNQYLYCSQFSCLMTAVGYSVVNKDRGTASFDCFTCAAKLTVWGVFKFCCHLHIVYITLFTIGFLCLLAEYNIRKNECICPNLLHILPYVMLCTTWKLAEALMLQTHILDVPYLNLGQLSWEFLTFPQSLQANSVIVPPFRVLPSTSLPAQYSLSFCHSV
jgi:hypothetical protein